MRAALLIMLLAGVAQAAEVKLRIHSVDAERKGKLYVQLCEEKDFLKPTCPFQQIVPVTGAQATLSFQKVPAGRWAALAFHDENGNGRLDVNQLGIPVEGTAFSRNAKGQYGPPKFADAAQQVSTENIEFSFRLAY
ncbi:DUF2141 domain-containing protein [Massilia sp. W12]|uniref:DUF2141 domain-containing protein n=1 Tax=Massilia sp. W12 TaxID=3126507 RepID=UPI0030CED6CA